MTKKYNMKMTILTLLISGLFGCKFGSEKIHVIERTVGISTQYISPADYDSTFVFANQEYLIRSKEFFDQDGRISHVLEWGGVGYTNWTSQMINETNDLFGDDGYSKTIAAYKLNNHQILVNSDTGEIKRVDSVRRLIYYTLKSKKSKSRLEYLNRLSYK
jgi:hypothetical protein